MDALNVVLIISDEFPDVPLTGLMCNIMRLVCTNNTKQVCVLPTHPIALSVGSYATACADPALFSASSPLHPTSACDEHAPTPPLMMRPSKLSKQE